MSLRTGGREAVEDEQIEPTEMQIAIAERMFDEWCQYNGSDTGWASSEVDDDTRSAWIELAGVAVAAIGRAAQFMNTQDDDTPYGDDIDQFEADVATLSVIAAGGQE